MTTQKHPKMIEWKWSNENDQIKMMEWKWSKKYEKERDKEKRATDRETDRQTKPFKSLIIDWLIANNNIESSDDDTIAPKNDRKIRTKERIMHNGTMSFNKWNTQTVIMDK